MTREDRAGGSGATGDRARSFGVRACRRTTGELVTHVMPLDEAYAYWWARTLVSREREVFIDTLDDDYRTITTRRYA
jgi:hypothetical protein